MNYFTVKNVANNLMIKNPNHTGPASSLGPYNFVSLSQAKNAAIEAAQQNIGSTYEVFETIRVGRAGPSIPPVVWEALSE